MQTVIISVYGGVANLKRAPKDVKVVIHDYDTDGVFGDVRRDSAGDDYQRIVLS